MNKQPPRCRCVRCKRFVGCDENFSPCEHCFPDTDSLSGNPVTVEMCAACRVLYLQALSDLAWEQSPAF